MYSVYLQRLSLIVAGLLVIVIVTGVVALASGVQPGALGALGIPGVFLLMLLSNGSILLPIPGLPTVAAAGAVWPPLLVGVAAALGGATGELSGYAAGMAGSAALEIVGRRPPSSWTWVHAWMSRYGFLTILVLALVPNPVFDAVGVLAGMQGYPLRRFWLACFLGNLGKCVAAAYLGESVRWLLDA